MAYTLFWVKLERPHEWANTVGAQQLEQFVFSFAGICIIVGVLHGSNVLVSPFVGDVLALRERLGLASNEG